MYEVYGYEQILMQLQLTSLSSTPEVISYHLTRYVFAEKIYQSKISPVYSIIFPPWTSFVAV